MASKQLGRLRQWAGEVMSLKDRSSVNEEFGDLEKDIELRKDGMQRVLTASDAYQYTLSKKKPCDALDEGERLLPIDALGIVMIVHGEEYGQDSIFGQALVKYGRAHCKIATLQEAYALTFKDTYISSINQFRDEIKEYESLRKKFDNRRSIYEAAASKYDKVLSSKKEKERREAEEEMERARQRYEETAEDLRAHMHAIQEKEITQHRDLSNFLDLETNFVQSYLDVLKEVKADWQDHSSSQRPRRGSQTLSSVPTQPKSYAARSNGHSQTNLNNESPDSSDDENPKRIPSKHRKNSSVSSRPPSRPASRLSRKRTNSNAPSVAPSENNDKNGSEKPRRMSVADWASSAVDSVTGGKSKKKDKDSFTNIEDEPDLTMNGEAHHSGPNNSSSKSSSFLGLARRSSQKDKSKENLPISSPKVSSKILKPPSLQDQKLVQALYDFTGSSDELSFKAGNQIVVLNEVLDDWWMGEVNGRKGLFPISYTKVLSRSLKENGTSERDEYVTSDDDGDLRAEPMSIKSPFYGGFNDAASFSDSMAEEVDELKMQPMVIPSQTAFDDTWFSQEAPMTPPAITSRPRKRSIFDPLDPARQPLINRTQSDNTDITPVKKAPPPPPPRRNTTQASSSPPIPQRRVFPASASSSSSGPGLTPSSSISSHGYDRSPFESAIELDAQQCSQFRQNPFKPRGICSNCLKYHD